MLSVFFLSKFQKNELSDVVTSTCDINKNNLQWISVHVACALNPLYSTGMDNYVQESHVKDEE